MKVNRVPAVFKSVILVCSAILLSSCATLKELDEVQSLHDQKNFQELATHEISCKIPDEGCNKVYLLKGDACFRLADRDLKSGDRAAEKADLSCAVSTYRIGLQNTSDWQAINMASDRYYENYCEALRRKYDRSRGEEANKVVSELNTASKKFIELHPNNLGANFFNIKAELIALEPKLINPTNPDTQLCSELLGYMKKASSLQPKNETDRYFSNYKQLRKDIKGAQRLASCN